MKKFIKNNQTKEQFLESFNLSKTNINIIIKNNLIHDSLDYYLIDLSNLSVEKPIPYEYNFNILYEDDYIIAIDKPEKILIHSDGNTNKTLVNAVSNYFLKTNQLVDVRVVHRLDYETSGVVLFAKDILTQSHLNYQFANDLIRKEYIVVVDRVVNRNGTINSKIGRNRNDRRKYLVTPNGKDAYTEYKVLAKNDKRSLLEVIIKTGRTHQIRVHLNSVGYSILGDELYYKKDKRLFLHAKKISFIHPNTKDELIIDSKIPKEFLNGFSYKI